MMKVCPKCGEIVLDPVPVDEKGERWQQNVEYPLQYVTNEDGKFVICGGCGEKFRVISGVYKGVSFQQFLGLKEVPEG